MSIPLNVIRENAGQEKATDLDQRREKIAAELAGLDVGELRFGRHDRMLYSTDASLYQVEPIGVIIPAAKEQARRAIRYCAENGIAVLPRGGGTSLAGQSINEAIVLDFSPRFRDIEEIDVAGRVCRAQSGMSIDELNRALAAHKTGLFFAADPATVAQACIGGCIGNNAAGARSIRYGRTSENLAGVEVILSTGERVTLEAGAGGRDPTARKLAEEVIGVVRRHSDAIRERFPKLVRRNAGYGLDLVLGQLDSGAGAEDLDLSGLICGSEGTLAVVLSAKLKLQALPLARGLAIVSFPTVDEAIAAVRGIIGSGVSAVELLDEVVLDAARENAECRQYLRLIPKINGEDAGAALYVEYQAEQGAADPEAELALRFQTLETLTPGAPTSIYRDAQSMQCAWTLRRSGEALLHNIVSARKPVTFVEDNSIPVENLSRFVRSFRQIVTSHGTTAAYYAHASVGVLHVRPMLDLHAAADLETLRKIAVEVADLARECGGVMSGEHGDGRVRGPLLERFYGSEIMSAFAEIKRIFDPAGVLNPGMIVGAKPVAGITDDLRAAAQRKRIDSSSIDTYFSYEDQEGFGHAIERCNGAGFCRKTAGGTMCPSYRGTLDERHSTRGRGNALRLAITGQVKAGSAAWDDAETMRTLDLCLSCKACKTECPSNVDLARLKAEFMAQRFRAEGRVPIKARAFGRIRLLSRMASLAPGLANSITQSRPARALANRILGLSPKRSLPEFSRSLYRDYRGRQQTHDRGARAVLFADCFTAYHEPKIGRAALDVLDSLGYAPLLPRVGCCGRAMISTGLLDEAVETIDRTLADLREFILDDSVKAVVVCEPSCLSAIKDEWLDLRLNTAIELRKRLAEKAMLAEEFVERYWDLHPRRPTRLEFAPGGEVMLHGHCHQKALWGEESSAAILRRLAGDRVRVIPSGCCGMAGSFGFTADHYDLSMRIGELSLFGPIREAPQALVLAPGTSCRHQIRDGTGREALHPIEWLARQIGAATF